MLKQEENLYAPNCIRTFSGKYLNVFEPDPELICIEDIAHSLSMQCRFAGHLPVFYSVGQHSKFCSDYVDNDADRLGALMHDASETYLTDMPSPIKRNMPEYRTIEDNLMKVIAEKFGFEYPFSKNIKAIDEIALQIEWNQLMLGKKPEHDEHLLVPLSQAEAKAQFLSTFLTLKGF
ncbi:hypothetical protein MA9V2_188 [Chryseobacterium phage MA9V-2]|nr:hypothetical protein MA9V2_188 [Chryseobacterium phage MA9V-2]